MRKQRIYTNLARYYDLVYSWKDYKKEVGVISHLIAKYRKSSGNELLDVACGTGKHAQHLKKDFRVLATDINPEMLRMARKTVAGVRFLRADMVTLDLGRQFDAIICLFSSIAYVKTYRNLKRTLSNFSRHLKPGGVLIVEPWFTRSTYQTGAPHMSTYGDDDIKIARQSTSAVRGDLSIIDMHFLVAERSQPVEHFSERHEMALFERAKVLQFMRAAGLQPKLLKRGLMKNRGLYVGVKK